MTGLIFGAPTAPTLELLGSDQRIAVNRTYYVGLNYQDHAKEMGASAPQTRPSFFTKPIDTLLPVPDGEDGRLPYPPATADLQHEIELVVVIGREGQDIAEDEADSHIFGYGLGLDMTRRDLQRDGRFPVAKVFDHASPISPIIPRAQVSRPDGLALELRVNGEVRQSGATDQLIWSIPKLIAALSTLYRLHPGDVLFTGTPAGTASVERGDRLDGRLDNLLTLSLIIA